MIWGVGKDDCSQEKVKWLVFCAGLSELRASSWDACSENGSVSMIWGWGFWTSDIKRSSIGHLGRPRWMVGSLELFDLGKSSSMFLKNNLSNHYYSNPHFRGIIYRGQLKEICGTLSKLHEAWRVCNLQEHFRRVWSVKASYRIIYSASYGLKDLTNDCPRFQVYTLFKRTKRTFTLKDNNCYREQNVPQLWWGLLFSKYHTHTCTCTCTHTHTQSKGSWPLTQTDKGLIPALPLTYHWGN